MNWYTKLASPSLFEPRRLVPSKRPAEKVKFFNFLKSQNIAFDCFHGTSLKAWDLSQKAGYLTSPHVRGADDNEGREDEEIDPGADADLQRGRKQIFLTTSKDYADWYARSTASLDKSQPITLSLKIPLYAIAEVQAAIFGKTQVYNEWGLTQRIMGVIDADWDNALKVEFIKTEIEKKFKLGAIKANEITTFLALPIKWVTNVEEAPQVKSEWHSPENFNPFQAINNPDALKQMGLFQDDIPDPPDNFVDAEWSVSDAPAKV